MQGGQLLAQGNDAGGDRAVVVLAFMSASRHACPPHGFTQVAARREGQEWLGQ